MHRGFQGDSKSSSIFAVFFVCISALSITLLMVSIAGVFETKTNRADQSFQILKLHFWFSVYSAVVDFVDDQNQTVQYEDDFAVLPPRETQRPLSGFRLTADQPECMRDLYRH